MHRNPIKKKVIEKINLGKIQNFIEKKSIDNKEKINLELLKKLNIIRKRTSRLKILGTGDIKEKIVIEAHFFSKSAKEKLEKIGGTAEVLKNKA